MTRKLSVAVANLVAYALCGESRQPVVSVSENDPLAQVQMVAALTTHKQDCDKRGVPFDVVCVSENLTADGNGQTTLAEFQQVNPTTGEKTGEVFNSARDFFESFFAARKAVQ